jgi:phosphoesterase RecJ-like protein
MPDRPDNRQMRGVVEALQRGDRFLLAGHVDPDPDCVGSLLALDWALRSLGKTSVPVVTDPSSPNWDFLPHRQRLRSPEQVHRSEWESIVVVDGDLRRAGIVAEWAQTARLVINIDHHPTNSSSGTIRLLDPEASATGELIYALIAALDLHLNADAATLLYTAIVSDTGSFRFSNATERSLRIAADLVGYGAKPDYVAKHLYETHSWGYMRFLQRALQALERSEDGRVAWISLSHDLLTSECMRPEETEGLVQYPRMIEGVELAIIFRETSPQEVRVSFRSKNRLDVSALAAQLGGGGHARAAGCRLFLPLEHARATVLARVSETLKKQMSTQEA